MTDGQSSDSAKAATRAQLDAEIRYFQSSIASHQAAILKDQGWARIPFFGRTARENIAKEQVGIDLAVAAIKRYQDLEAYYASIGRL